VHRHNGQDRDTIVIIDDDVEWTDALRIYFSKAYDVRVANSSDDALELIRANSPRAIILDLVMPSVDGFGLVCRMNEMSIDGIPIVLITGWNNPAIEECAASIGCAAVLSKPVSLPDLEAVISSLTRRDERRKATQQQ
jgi:DNA-binding response OmpR family regulator